MKDFIIRAYGILRNGRNQILLSKETYCGEEMVKFPGGGLQYGEGLVDCLKREWQEELEVSIKIKTHFYTTEFFQKSAFDDRQVISVYYLVELEAESNLSEEKMRTKRSDGNNETFFWQTVNHKLVDPLTFPIDRKVARMIAETP